jgi:hypothetical protein
VVRALQRWPALAKLELGNIYIRKDNPPIAQEYFPLMAAHMPSLESLVLCNVGLGAQGAGVLATAPRLAPALRRLRISDAFQESYPAAVQTLMQTTWLRLTDVHICGGTAAAGAQIVAALHAAAAAGRLPALRALGFERVWLKDAELRVLLGANWLKLEEVNLDSNNIAQAGAAALAAAAPRCQKLQLIFNRIGHAGLQELARVSWPHLKALDLAGANLGPGCPALIAAARWTALEFLSLNHNDIKFGVRALGDVSWPFLHTLALYEAGMQPGDLAALVAGAGSWPALRILEVGGNALGLADLQALEAWAPELEHLCLSGCGVGPEGAAVLGSPRWSSLAGLDLADNNDLAIEGLQALASNAWPRLQELKLTCTGQGPAGAGLLAAAQWPALRVLHFGGNTLGDAGAQALARAELPFLEELDLQDDESLGPDGAAALAAAAPRWPALRTLAVGCALWQCAGVGEAGEQALVDAKWECMENLIIQKWEDD